LIGRIILAEVSFERLLGFTKAVLTSSYQRSLGNLEVRKILKEPTRNECQTLNGFNRKIRAAYHEAGHALYGFYHGLWISYATIDSFGGGTCHYDGLHRLPNWQELDYLIACSGVVAEDIWWERTKLEKREHDLFDHWYATNNALSQESEDCKKRGLSEETWHEIAAFFKSHYDELCMLARLIHQRSRHPKRHGNGIYNYDIERITGVRTRLSCEVADGRN
jgi:hypothetical protein